MSEKVLKLARRQPMFLALIVMATITIGLLFSGWLTPAPVKAQNGSGNPQTSQETTNCQVASTSGSCVTSGSIVLVAPTNSPAVVVGSGVSLSAGYLVVTGQVQVTTTYTNTGNSGADACPTTTTNLPMIPTILSSSWTASVGSFSTNGTGLTANFTPTCGGCGRVDFSVTYTNASPCNNSGSSGASGYFFVATLTTNCTSVPPVMGVSSTNFNFCIGTLVTLSVTNNNVTNAVWVTTNWPSCPGCTNVSANGPTNYVSPAIVSNWWTVSGPGNFSTNGTGLSATFTPTNCGAGTVTFNETYKNNTPCDPTNVYSANPISLGFNVDAVTSLTPNAGVWVDDGDGDPNTDTYLVQSGCHTTITVTASDSLGLSPEDLPECWTVALTGATFVDNKHFTIDGNTIGKSIISVTCGNSHKTITVIVYEAVYVINADHGDCELTQHAWWDLAIRPSDVDPFLTRDNGADLSVFMGLCGYYGQDGSISCGDAGCPAHLEFGPQPISGTDPVEYYAATGSYWWCISFTKLIGALTYVDDLDQDPGLYTITSNSCVTQAINVGNAAGETISFSGYTACALSSWLNNMRSLCPPVCYCQTGN
jgi:hypothetical protein